MLNIKNYKITLTWLIIFPLTGIGFILTFTSTPGELPNSSDNYKSKSFENDKETRGYINSSGDEIFWFIHISDIQNVWHENDNIANFKQFLDETYHTIQPNFIFNTGDLVNPNYRSFSTENEGDQNLYYWKKYKNVLDHANMNISSYIDIVGNHDCDGDPTNRYFLKYSMTGSTYNALQYSFDRAFSFGDYAFIGLHTAQDHGIKFPFSVFGYLNTAELDWYEEQLEKYKDCEKIFIFGHFSTFEILSSLSTNGMSFSDLNKKYGVDYYFAGHRHNNFFDNVNGMLILGIKSFEQNGGTYRIVSIDNNQLSTSLEVVGEWPQAIITYPPREKYILNDIGKKNMEINKDDLKQIRVLAWDPKGIHKIEWAAYDSSGNERITDWEEMIKPISDNPLYQAKWNEDLNDGKEYLIKVKIKGGSGKTTKTIVFNIKKGIVFGLYEAIPIITISFIALVAIAFFFNYYRRTHMPKYKKKDDELVNKELRNLYLLKILIFLIVPLSFGGMYVGQLTAVFSLFYLNIWGLHLNITLFLYTGSLFLTSILWQAWCLSKKHTIFSSITLLFSILSICFLVLYFIFHYPTVSWLSPGLYGMLFTDILTFMRRQKIRNI